MLVALLALVTGLSAAGASASHTPAPRPAGVPVEHAPHTTRAIELYAPVAALPGPALDLAELSLPGQSRARTGPAASVRLPAGGPAPLHHPGRRTLDRAASPVCREPLIVCGFVSSRPTAPPAIRS